MNFDKLSIDEKIGQRFIFGINDKNIDCIIKLIENSYIGGVVLYKKNYSNCNELLDVVKRIKTANKNNRVPLFIAIDEEGGLVDRMPPEIHDIKSVYDVSKCGDKLVKDSANMIGKMLSSVGINMNFAPVLDIDNDSNNKALYKRCFYGDSKGIARFGNMYTQELVDNNIISVVKHFPGHGASVVDSHFFIPHVFDYKSILDKHIYPFYEVIKNNVDAVMVGHIVVRKLTNGVPASLSSKFIDNYLRSKFDGLIITDEINMLKRHLRYRYLLTNKALKSSSDILLVKIRDVNEGYKIIDEYKKLLSKNSLYIRKLDDSVDRILRIKDKYKINDNVKFNGIDVDRTNEEIDRISKIVESRSDK